jgi:hypothetical protein
MAFVSSITQRVNFGNQRVVIGQFTGTSVQRGEVTTGLDTVRFFAASCQGTSTNSGVMADEVFPLSSTSAVTITFTSGVDGTWLAIGT